MTWIDRIEEVKNINEKYTFDAIDKKVDSYYEPYNNKKYIEEYNFSTVMELKDKFIQLWNKDGFIINYANDCAVTAFSKKPNISAEEFDDNESWNVSEFIYTL